MAGLNRLSRPWSRLPMTLVKVTTLKGALDALAAINNHSTSFPHC